MRIALSVPPAGGDGRRGLLAVVAPSGRTALPRRLLTHLYVIAASGRRVAILDGAKEFRSADLLAGLGQVSHAALLDAG